MQIKNKIIKQIAKILEQNHIKIIEYVLFKVIGYSSNIDPSLVYAAYVEYIINNHKEFFPKILFGFIKKLQENNKKNKYKEITFKKQIASYIYSICILYDIKISKRKIIKFVNLMCG
ncbi:MAG: hypothetical protein QXF12_00145 [Candidatus Aenigmatarchaeota archaeon]